MGNWRIGVAACSIVSQQTVESRVHLWPCGQSEHLSKIASSEDSVHVAALNVDGFFCRTRHKTIWVSCDAVKGRCVERVEGKRQEALFIWIRQVW